MLVSEGPPAFGFSLLAILLGAMPVSAGPLAFEAFAAGLTAGSDADQCPLKLLSSRYIAGSDACQF
jgi:hypothetical protein